MVRRFIPCSIFGPEKSRHPFATAFLLFPNASTTGGDRTAAMRLSLPRHFNRPFSDRQMFAGNFPQKSKFPAEKSRLGRDLKSNVGNTTAHSWNWILSARYPFAVVK
jgi:hypothetical protein